MRLLIVADHYPVCSARYYSDAFTRLGADVRHIGNCTRNNIWGIQVDKRYNWYPDGNLAHSWGDWQPDAVIICDTGLRGYIHPYYRDVPHVVITVDNHVRNVEQDGIQHYFLAHYHGEMYPVDPARTDHSWLPCAYDPMWFTPSPINWFDRPYDVAMVGVMYSERVEIIEAMQKAGLSVYATTGLLYEDYRNVYWQSKIALCSSAAGDVAQRIFECGAMGCTILTDRLYDLETQHTNERLGLRGWTTYSKVATAVSVAIELTRDNPEMGAGAALRMQQTCKPHTWDARAQLVLNYLEGKPYEMPAPYVSQTGMVKVKENGYGEGMLIA